ncbi:hypothetical protein TrRE_jg3212, partial [Triparma retinervis]
MKGREDDEKDGIEEQSGVDGDYVGFNIAEEGEEGAEKEKEEKEEEILPMVEDATLRGRQIYYRRALSLLVGLMGGGVTWFWKGEGVELVDSVYFVCTTLATIGHGDVLPTRLVHPLVSRLTTTFLSCVGVLLVGNFAAISIVSRGKGKGEREELTRFICIVLALWGVGTLGLKMLGGGNWGTLAYFVMQTLTTLGLGDVRQVGWKSKLFLSFYSLFGTAIFGGVVGAIASIPLEINEKKAKESVLESLPDELNEEVYKFLSRGTEVQRLGLSKNKGYCSKNEFTLLMLIRQGLINEKDLELCREKFDKLDTDRSGKITRADLVQVQSKRWVRGMVRGLVRGILGGGGEMRVVAEE